MKLALYKNQLSGSIPTDLGNLTNLEGLNLRVNQLSGAIPASLSSLTHLSNLNLRDNQLSGSIPAGLGSLTNLVVLDLGNNQLSGSIPPQLGNLTLLTNLNLISNRLTGSIPAQLGNLTLLTNLDLSNNQLSGGIPTELGSLTSLKTLYLWGNQLNGSIPAQLGNLTGLTWLDLGGNQLSGSIPTELTQLVNIPDPDPQLGAMLELTSNWLTVPSPYPSTPPTALEAFLMQKNPGWETTQGVQAGIPTSGGTAQSADGSVSLTVEPGEVSQNVKLQITTLTGPAAGGFISGNRSFAISAYGEDGILISPFLFEDPVELAVSYTDEDVPEPLESELLLYFWDSGTASWIDAAQTCTPASAYTRDMVNNTLSVDICHLTRFSLMVERYTLRLPIIYRH